MLWSTGLSFLKKHLVHSFVFAWELSLKWRSNRGEWWLLHRLENNGIWSLLILMVQCSQTFVRDGCPIMSIPFHFNQSAMNNFIASECRCIRSTLKRYKWSVFEAVQAWELWRLQLALSDVITLRNTAKVKDASESWYSAVRKSYGQPFFSVRRRERYFSPFFVLAVCSLETKPRDCILHWRERHTVCIVVEFSSKSNELLAVLLFMTSAGYRIVESSSEVGE